MHTNRHRVVSQIFEIPHLGGLYLDRLTQKLLRIYRLDTRDVGERSGAIGAALIPEEIQSFPPPSWHQDLKLIRSNTRGNGDICIADSTPTDARAASGQQVRVAGPVEGYIADFIPLHFPFVPFNSTLLPFDTVFGLIRLSLALDFFVDSQVNYLSLYISLQCAVSNPTSSTRSNFKFALLSLLRTLHPYSILTATMCAIFVKCTSRLFKALHYFCCILYLVVSTLSYLIQYHPIPELALHSCIEPSSIHGLIRPVPLKTRHFKLVSNDSIHSNSLSHLGLIRVVDHRARFGVSVQVQQGRNSDYLNPGSNPPFSFVWTLYLCKVLTSFFDAFSKVLDYERVLLPFDVSHSNIHLDRNYDCQNYGGLNSVPIHRTSKLCSHSYLDSRFIYSIELTRTDWLSRRTAIPIFTRPIIDIVAELNLSSSEMVRKLRVATQLQLRSKHKSSIKLNGAHLTCFRIQAGILIYISRACATSVGPTNQAFARTRRDERADAAVARGELRRREVDGGRGSGKQEKDKAARTSFGPEWVLERGAAGRLSAFTAVAVGRCTRRNEASRGVAAANSVRGARTEESAFLAPLRVCVWTRWDEARREAWAARCLLFVAKRRRSRRKTDSAASAASREGSDGGLERGEEESVGFREGVVSRNRTRRRGYERMTAASGYGGRWDGGIRFRRGYVQLRWLADVAEPATAFSRRIGSRYVGVDSAEKADERWDQGGRG
ncbi:hypothetical protein R3P38DRAFT_2767694 [Favolaschia claudopus]|uniref:Uncharacterized protein n=1 Tax=Favolaschia claudopus TaxID=2862362 RepID=A0AAW0CUH2_9AGAR